MNIPVRIRSHRNLRPMKNYYSLLPDTNYFDSEYAKKQYPIHLNTDESLIGVYENILGDDLAFHDVMPAGMRDNIIITSKESRLWSKPACLQVLNFNSGLRENC